MRTVGINGINMRPVSRKILVKIFVTTLMIKACFAAASVNLFADSLETQTFSAGFSVTSDSNYTLESTVGEVSDSSMTAGTKSLFPGHSGNSHSPGVVSDLSVSTLSKTEARFDWTEKGNDGDIGLAASVEIKIATYPVSYSNYSTITSSISLSALPAGNLRQQIYSTLSPGNTYYVAIRVIGRNNIPGRISSVSFYTEAVKPEPPAVAGIFSGNSFIISWSEVNEDTEGSSIEIKNYRVYYSTSLTGIISGPITLSSYTLSYMAETSPARWYFVKAVDSKGVESDSSLWLSNSQDVVRTVSDDSMAIVEFSRTLNALLNSEELSPLVSHMPEKEIGDVLSAYNFYLKNSAGNVVKTDLSENAALTLPLSGSGSVHTSSIKPMVSYGDYDYAVFYYNGVEDVKLGGLSLIHI